MSLAKFKTTTDTEEDINLDNNGVHILMDEIDDTSCKTAMEWILKENFKKKRAKFLTLMICSYGGSVPSAFALIDVMKGSSIPVHTRGLGAIGSCGFLIFISGEKGHRIITPNTSILSHQYSWGDYGKYHELVATRCEQDRMLERMIIHYQKCLGLSKKEITEKLLPAKDIWLSAKEALQLGVCDKVLDL